MIKKITGLYQAPGKHWVGNGFHVEGIFDYQSNPDEFSPFLLLDFAQGKHFAPTTERRGVGKHPHRGFETVTIVYAGEAEHKDSQGNGGVIGPGDVQWMTAGSGIIHEEYHSEDFSKKGGLFEMVQLWVNLPRAHKMALPQYQHLTKKSIPTVPLEGGELRVIAGNYDKVAGPAQTFTPVNVWNVRLDAQNAVELVVPQGHTTLALVVRGSIQHEEQKITPATLITFDREGNTITFTTGKEDAWLLVLTGERIAEPVVGHGPFVMNSAEEINQAMDDFQRGTFLKQQ
jgi:redox-sensitive bicupin YhaK (pirin superfamily)